MNLSRTRLLAETAERRKESPRSERLARRLLQRRRGKLDAETPKTAKELRKRQDRDKRRRFGLHRPETPNMASGTRRSSFRKDSKASSPQKGIKLSRFRKQSADRPVSALDGTSALFL